MDYNKTIKELDKHISFVLLKYLGYDQQTRLALIEDYAKGIDIRLIGLRLLYLSLGGKKSKDINANLSKNIDPPSISEMWDALDDVNKFWLAFILIRSYFGLIPEKSKITDMFNKRYSDMGFHVHTYDLLFINHESNYETLIALGWEGDVHIKRTKFDVPTEIKIYEHMEMPVDLGITTLEDWVVELYNTLFDVGVDYFKKLRREL